MFNSPIQHGPRGSASAEGQFYTAASVHHHGHVGNTVCRNIM